MKKVKRFFMVLLVLIMSVSLFASCNEETNNSTETGAETSGEKIENNVAEFDASKLSSDNVATETIDLLNSVDSLHISHNVDMEISMMGRAQKMNVNMESDVSLADEKAHIVGNVDNSPLSLTTEMYLEKNGDDASIYANMNNTTWMKQNVKVADLKQVDGYDDAFEATKYYLEVLKDAEISDSSYNGKSAVLVTGILDTEDPEGLMNNMGMQSQGMGLNTAMFQQMLTGLEAVDFSMYLDSATGLPLEVKVDMTKFMNSVYANLGKVFGGNGVPVDVKLAVGTIVFSDYNNVTVAVPAEVEAAVSGK